jgi:hypothetical protein
MQLLHSFTLHAHRRRPARQGQRALRRIQIRPRSGLRVCLSQEALLNAKGVDLGAPAKAGKGGRKLSFFTKVQFNGNLMVGKAYTAQLGLEPGDEFEIKLGRKQIKLVPLGTTEDDEE